MSARPTDLLTVEDIAAEYGWTTERAGTLLRSLGRRGLVTTFEGHRRLYISRANLQGAMRQDPAIDYSSSGGMR